MATASARQPSVDLVAALAIGTTIVAWASAFAGIRAGLRDFGPFELGSLRFAIAAVPAALFLVVTRPPWPTAREFARLVVVGLVFIAFYTLFLNYGEQTVSAGAASFIIQLSPILTAILAGLFLGERFGVRGWIGTLISFLGIGLIAAGEEGGLRLGGGAVLILGSALSAAIATILQKPLFDRHRPLTVAAWTMIFGALFLVPGLPSAAAQFAAAGTEGRVAVVYLAIVPSVIAYGAFAIALSRMPAGRTTNFLYCVAPVATLIGFVWLGEVPTLLGIVGGVIALSGVIFVNLRSRIQTND